MHHRVTRGSRSSVMCLDDLAARLGPIDLIMVHGLAAGGGERVADELSQLTGARQVSHAQTAWARMRAMLGAKRIVFTSGPRDLPWMVLAWLGRRESRVYVQVPYHLQFRGLTTPAARVYALWRWWLARRPDHVAVCSSAARNAVAGALLPSFLPFSRSRLAELRAEEQRRSAQTPDASPRNGQPPRWVTVARFNATIGRDAKGFERFMAFVEALHRRNAALPSGARSTIEHFGACDTVCSARLQPFVASGDVILRGTRADWLRCHGASHAVFFSQFEGFGLAALEAAHVCETVWLTKGFPDELLNLRSNFRHFDPDRPFDLIARCSPPNIEHLANERSA